LNIRWRELKHPDANLFEDYFFDRLSELETAKFEGHLLMCQECQKTLASTEEYIALMKGASLAYEACPRGSQRNSVIPLKRGGSGNNRTLH
jgi:hypothetical protein